MGWMLYRYSKPYPRCWTKFSMAYWIFNYHKTY